MSISLCVLCMCRPVCGSTSLLLRLLVCAYVLCVCVRMHVYYLHL